MNNFIKRYTDVPLILRIVIGMVIGIALALAAPGISWIGTLGSLFTTALKAIAPILVFFLVIGALCTARSAGNMKTVICLYIVSTLVAGALAVVASYLFPSELVLTGVDAADATGAPQELSSVIVALLTNALSNPVDALASANYLGVLMWAVFIGIALRKAKSTTKDLLQDAAKAVTTVVRGVIEYAPFGILGLIYSSVSTSGVEIFTVYGHLVAVLVAVILVVALVTNPLIVFLACRVNPYPLVLRCLKESAVMAFFTRSSAANTIAIMTMAACNTLGIVVDPVLSIMLCIMAAIGACGTSGVAGGSLMLIPLACSLFSIDPAISAQVVAVGFIIGVIQDSCETALNSSSDVVFTAAAELRARRRKGLSCELPIREEDRTHGIHLDGAAAVPSVDPTFVEKGPSTK